MPAHETTLQCGRSRVKAFVQPRLAASVRYMELRPDRAQSAEMRAHEQVLKASIDLKNSCGNGGWNANALSRNLAAIAKTAPGFKSAKVIHAASAYLNVSHSQITPIETADDSVRH